MKIVFVCLGNICRSPLAEGIAREQIRTRGWDGWMTVDSAGTSGYHDGEPPDPGSVRVARSHGLDLRGLRSRKLTRDDVERADLLVAMDGSNRTNILAVGTVPEGRLVLQRVFDPDPRSPDVPDPWGRGAGAFDEVWSILWRSMPGLLEHARALGERGA
jgi:protein-tyrosine phosphatase